MKKQEEWKVVAECDGQYYVSNLGRVKSYVYYREKIVVGGIQGKGYRKVYIRDKMGNSKQMFVHRLVALAFIANPDNKKQVNHKDGYKLNNHIDNLEWMTPQENVQHAWNTGLNENRREKNKEYAKLKFSKPVVDILTKNKYNSLKDACIDIEESYSKHSQRISNKSKSQRFFRITDGNR